MREENNMKVILFSEYLASGFGGTEAVVRDLANFLSNIHDVALGYLDLPPNPQFEYNEKIRHIVLGSDPRLFLKNVLDFDPDIFILFCYSKAVFTYIKLLYGHGIPIVCHEGAFPERVISHNWMNKDISRAKALWERDLAYSEAFKIRFIFDDYKTSLSKFNYPRGIAFLNPLVRYGFTSQKQNKIINIGGCKKNKNIFPLLEAFSNVLKTYPEWELHIYSQQKDKKYTGKIKDFISDHNMQNSVILHNPTIHIHEEYANSAFHVITSESESLSLAVAESMCHGIPSIGFAHCPGVNKLIRDGINGLLVNGGDNAVQDLTEAIITLIKNKDLRHKLGQTALADAAVFDPETIYKSWLNIIEESTQYKNTDLLQQKQIATDKEAALHYIRMKKILFTEDN